VLRLGLCLSERSVALALIDCSQKFQPTIKDSFYFDYFSEKGGVDECKSQLNQFIERYNLKKNDCYAVLNKEDYQLLLIDPPDVPDEELVEATRWKVKDVANVDIDNSVITTFPQPEKKMHYTVVAEKSKIIRLIEFIKDINLSLVAIDIEELSYRNYFELIGEGKSLSKNIDLNEKSINSEALDRDRGVAVISIGKNEGKLLIIKNGQLFLSRRFSIEYSGYDVDVLPEDEIILELQRSLDYYERQMRQVAPAEIVFCGAIKDEKITPIMKDSFQQKVSCVDMLSLLDGHDLRMSADEALVLSGAALRTGTAL